MTIARYALGHKRIVAYIDGVKTHCIISTLLSLITLAGCSHIWTYKFVVHDNATRADLKNWELEPDIFSVENIIADSDSLLPKDDYIISLKFKNAHRTNTLFEICLDTIRLSFFGKLGDTTLVVKSEFYYGSASDKHMKKHFDFIPINDIDDIETSGFASLFIPDNVDSLLLTTTISLLEGTHMTHYRKNSKIERDSIVVTPDSNPIVVPLDIILYKYREKGRAVSLFSEH